MGPTGRTLIPFALVITPAFILREGLKRLKENFTLGVILTTAGTILLVAQIIILSPVLILGSIAYGSYCFGDWLRGSIIFKDLDKEE